MIRRNFIKNTGATILTAPLAHPSFEILINNSSVGPLDIHLFSKHLQFLDINDAATVANEMGFKGLDLTVRPKGHILPENVESDLPKAIQEIKNSGLTCEMITTAVSDVDNLLDCNVIKIAAQQGVKYYRSNWFSYKEDQPLEESLNYYRNKVQQLSKLNKEYSIIGCYQNHSGIKIGASVWEVKSIIQGDRSDYFGVQYDIRHAVVEGGRSWPNGVRLLRDHIKTIVLKDFKWGKVNGKWTVVNVPIGEGMVDFTSYFKLLKSFGLRPLTSMHFEYPLGGAEKGRYEITVDKKEVFKAMRKDLIEIQRLWRNA